MTQEPDLRVQIPERFREGILRRFDPANATVSGGWWKILVPCGLCKEFNVASQRCKGCPFGTFDPGLGCSKWIRTVLGVTPLHFTCDANSVRWTKEDDTLVRQRLTKLRARAEELIEWTEVESKPRSTEMRATAMLAAKAETKPEQTLADLDDDVLVITTCGNVSGIRRFKRGRTVYDLEHGDHGRVGRTGDGPVAYAVHEILGPLVFSFED